MEWGIGVLLILYGLSKVIEAARRPADSFLKGGRGRRLPAIDDRELKMLREFKTQYEERIQHLETIVSDVDFELNRKLNRLAASQHRLLPPPKTEKPSGAKKESGDKVRVAVSADAEIPATHQAPLTTLTPGSRLADRFVIVRRIGAGSMGEVFEARDEELGEPVAIKVMAGLSLVEPDALERFRREARAARRITHPNVVRMHDIGEDRGLHFISMEYVEGETLREWLQREGVLTLADVHKVVSQVCNALEAAHEAGVVHRDLKPDNILIDGDGRLRIIDFGVARLPYLEGMTATGVIMGTPEYMAPEQVRGEPVDERADIYALGAIMFHTLTGHTPFKGSSPIAIGFAQCSEPLPPLSEYRDVPEEWNALVQRAMAKQPQDRFATAKQLRAALPAQA